MQILVINIQTNRMLKPNQLQLIQLLAKQVSAGILTQNALAEATDVHQSQISRILAGNVRRASKNVLKLCKYAESLPSAAARPDLSYEVLAALSKLLGNSNTEDQALAQLVASLTDWRMSWRDGR